MLTLLKFMLTKKKIILEFVSKGKYIFIAIAILSAVGYHFVVVKNYNHENVKLETKLETTKTNLDIAISNQIKLNDAINNLKQSQVLLEHQRKVDQEKIDQLSKEYQASNKKVGNLRQLLSKHDIRYLMLMKPGLVENRMNIATKKLGDEFENITSGGELNE